MRPPLAEGPRPVFTVLCTGLTEFTAVGERDGGRRQVSRAVLLKVRARQKVCGPQQQSDKTNRVSILVYRFIEAVQGYFCRLTHNPIGFSEDEVRTMV